MFVKNKPGNYKSRGWYDGDNRGAGGSGGGAGAVSQSGSATIVEVYKSITLANDSDNSSVISEASGNTAIVTLQGRTLYKDGSWNTLCLPFGLGSFVGTPLEGATVKTLASASISNGTLTMNFTEDVSSIEAGKPYIVKWADGTDIATPVFNGVIISTATAKVGTGYVEFLGTYAPVTITDGGDNTLLYLGAANKLYYPPKAMTIGSQRAYFRLLGGLTAGDPASPASVRAFVLNFGDGETTGINEIVNSESSDSTSLDAWYTLDGRRLDTKPTAKGVYIRNGRKIVIK